MERIPLYLIALIVAIANTPLNIYQVNAWNLGTVAAAPWRRRTSGLVMQCRSIIDRFRGFLWRHRLQGITLAAAVLMLFLLPHGAGAVCIVGHIAQLEADLKTKQAAAKELLEKTMRACADHVVTPAANGQPEVKGRLMTAEEKSAIDAILAEAKGIKARIDGHQSEQNLAEEINRLTANMRPSSSTPDQPSRQRSLGQQFVADTAYREFIQAGGHRRAGNWTSPAVDLQATTLDTSSGSGGPLILPDQQPGVIPLLFKRLVVADLIAPGTTDSNSIAFMKEKTFTNAADAVAEAGLKPESTLVFEAATSAVRKIAHWIPVTEEMLEDFAQTQSIIDARLRLGLDLREEDELLNGSGVAPHLLGLMTLTGLTAAVARGADSNADAIFKQITAIATTVFVSPDGIVMNPGNWQTVQLTKNAAGNYMGSGPWAPAQPAQLWGLPVAVTPSIVLNTALVGAYRAAAQIFRKGGVRVESSNSHASFFINNLVAIRAEERLALAVYREAAFGKVTGLN